MNRYEQYVREEKDKKKNTCLLYRTPSQRDRQKKSKKESAWKKKK